MRIDGGSPLDFIRYPFIPDILDRHARRTTIIKGAQLGLSVALILKCLGDARRGGLRGILYGFPSDREVQDFSKARFGPLMTRNPGQWPTGEGEIDSAGLKQIGDVAIYFRGIGQRGGAAKSLSPIKSIPVDRVVFDERDEMDDARVDEAEHRLDGSPFPELTALSTPTLPGFGVDWEYKLSNQSSWLWRCELCNGHTCLEDEYPECIAEPIERDPYYLCSKCRKELKRTTGEWVARRPDVTDHLGYWVSQLCSPTRSALDIVTAADIATRRGRVRDFYNQTLGRAYAEVEDQITVQQLEACLREERRPLTHEGPCAMGVDPGKPHWYEVRARITDTDTIQVARGRADSYEDLSAISKRYRVEAGVMDQGYDPSAVARFVSSHSGWFGGLYVGNKKSDPDWDHREKIVKMGRTRTLDDAHHEILKKRVSYYAKDEFWAEHWVPQMTNLKRATIENKINGQRDAAWVVTGGKKNDHLRHASAYAMLACTRVGLSKSVDRVVSQNWRDEFKRPTSAMVM